ncbi:uncharacterized protein LOC141900631 [Tubulanus polymorphus]|uniref:uncharacterized protein LOC141900631 n=1 Tax=Tubulanus polymorphus TaxID=672921 RepID=UPI003DA3B61F
MEALISWQTECEPIEIEVETFEEGETSKTSSVFIQTEEVSTVEVMTQTEKKPGMKASDYMFNDEAFHYYTGMNSYEFFRFLLGSFGQVVNELRYYYQNKPPLAIEDQFFLTLTKLRLARPHYELSLMFGCSEKEVKNIFVTWINFLHLHFKEINWWPSRDIVKFYSPVDFRRKYPTTRVVIDGTECPIMKPKQPVGQQATYSTYKNRNTVKALIGVTPGGMVSFVSDIYGGSASDRQICERSNLLQICDPGDSIMADKGFNMQDLFVPVNVAINIPEFFKKKNRMSASSVLQDRKIASKRVQVERVIGLAKTFKILKQPMNNTDSELADPIISVCFFLCNFKSAIVPRDA